MLRPTPGDPWGVEQHHWNTGAEENQQLNPGGPSNSSYQDISSREVSSDYKFVSLQVRPIYKTVYTYLYNKTMAIHTTVMQIRSLICMTVEPIRILIRMTAIISALSFMIMILQQICVDIIIFYLCI